MPDGESLASGTDAGNSPGSRPDWLPARGHLTRGFSDLLIQDILRASAVARFAAKVLTGMPSILAGIKTAAVLAVGTATLGALIGAGGYGQPILRSVRMNDILSGSSSAWSAASRMRCRMP